MKPVFGKQNMEQETPIAPEQTVDTLRQTAEALFRDPKLIEVCRHASRDRGLRVTLLNDPMELLRSREMDIPPEFTIEFFEPPSRSLPISDWVPFVLELTTCRTVWVKECDDGIPRKCHQSTINRRKQAILKGLRMRLRDRTEFQKLCIKLRFVSNFTNWLARFSDVALGA